MTKFNVGDKVKAGPHDAVIEAKTSTLLVGRFGSLETFATWYYDGTNGRTRLGEHVLDLAHARPEWRSACLNFSLTKTGPDAYTFSSDLALEDLTNSQVHQLAAFLHHTAKNFSSPPHPMFPDYDPEGRN